MIEKAFAVQFSSFTGCLLEAGYLPGNAICPSCTTHNGYYAMGFKQTVVVGVGCGLGGIYICNVTDYDAVIGTRTCAGPSGQYYPTKRMSGAALPGDNDLIDTSLSSNAFVVEAVAYI